VPIAVVVLAHQKRAGVIEAHDGRSRRPIAAGIRDLPAAGIEDRSAAHSCARSICADTLRQIIFKRWRAMIG